MISKNKKFKCRNSTVRYDMMIFWIIFKKNSKEIHTKELTHRVILLAEFLARKEKMN